MLLLAFFTFTTQILAQTVTSTPSPTRAPVTNGTTTAPPEVSTGTDGPPDVYLNVPELHVGRIELTVEELQADINLNAKVAGLVTVNAGVQVSVQKINITIADVDVNLELIVRLGNLVEIVERVFDSLDLNPLLIGLISNVTDLIGDVIGAVDGLLGSITQGGKTLNFIIDNLGNIVQEVVGGAEGALSQIVGNFQQSMFAHRLMRVYQLTILPDMTQVGEQKSIGQGLIQKTFEYAELGSLVDIVFNAAGQVVRATVQKKQGGGSSPSATPSPVTLPVETPVSTST